MEFDDFTNGSSGQVRGGGNMKSMRSPMVAIFFMTYFLQSQGDMDPFAPLPDPLRDLVRSKEHDCNDLKVSDLQANEKLAQKGEHQTRMAEVPNSILTGSNILSLDFFLFTQESL